MLCDVYIRVIPNERYGTFVVGIYNIVVYTDSVIHLDRMISIVE